MAPSFLDALARLAKAPSSSPSSSSSSSTVTLETATKCAAAAGGLAVLWATRAYVLHYADCAISLAQVRTGGGDAARKRKILEESDRATSSSFSSTPLFFVNPFPKPPPTTGQPRPPQAQPVPPGKLHAPRGGDFRKGPPGLPRRDPSLFGRERRERCKRQRRCSSAQGP